MLKQQLDNYKCATGTCKKFMGKSKTRGRPKIIIGKEMLKYLMSVGTSNKGIVKHAMLIMSYQHGGLKKMIWLGFFNNPKRIIL